MVGSAAGQVELATSVGGVHLANPVMTASGTSGYGAELSSYMDLSTLGAVVVKSLSAQAWSGNPPPRLHPLAAGMLNSVGLANPGVDVWLEKELPALAGTGAAVVASIWAFRAEGYEQAARALAQASRSGGPAASIVAVEANISCPNIEDRRRMFAHSCESTTAALRAVIAGLSGSGLPVWAKLSPNVTDLPSIAGAALEAGASALTLVNTLMGLAIDPCDGRPRLGAGGGGLSGPALHSVAVRAVYDCKAAWPQASIIGVGGVGNGVDAAEMLAAGANAVQVGTASFFDPRAAAKVLADLRRWCCRNRVRRVSDLIGRAHATRK